MFALEHVPTQRVPALGKLLALGLLGALLASSQRAAARDEVERLSTSDVIVQQRHMVLGDGRGAALSPQLTRFVFVLPEHSLLPRLSLGLADNTLVRSSSWDSPFALDVSSLLSTGVTLFVLAPSADNQEKNALRLAARYASSGGRLQLEGVW
ncbi:MAG TPA: hypothetical protein VFK05_21665 [Polyangiaceae bacterium]|nr:hypothetical protein [Polyangiaceae bacterium]